MWTPVTAMTGGLCDRTGEPLHLRDTESGESHRKLRPMSKLGKVTSLSFSLNLGFSWAFFLSSRQNLDRGNSNSSRSESWKR